MGTEGKKVAEASRLSFSEDQRRDASATFPPAPKGRNVSARGSAPGSTPTGNSSPEGAEQCWPFVRLAEVGVISGGLTKNSKRDSNELQVSYLRVGNVYQNELRLDEIKTIGLTEREFAKTRLERGDLLIVEGNGSKDQIGRLAIWDGSVEPCVHQNHLIRVRLSERVLPKFAVYWFSSQEGRSRIEHVASSTSGLYTLSVSKIGSLELPLPPLPEQRRIVARIEELFSRLDAGVAALRHAKAQLQRYRQSVLAAAVTGELTREWREQHPDTEPASTLLKRVLDQRRKEWLGKGKYKDPSPLAEGVFAALPPEWAIASLEALTDANRPICYGILMPKDNVPDGVLYVKVRDMRGDRINLESLQRTTPEIAAKYERASLKEGDLLLSIRGTYGRVALIPPELDGGNITQDSARLAVSELLSRDYVACAIRSHAIQTHFKNVARGVAVKGVNIGDVKPTPIPIPPLAEQHQIVAEVEARTTAIDHLEAELDRQISRSNRLRRSVLAEAFRGGLS